ncbi:hypothetical protein G7Y89_g3056 [Cudoniella acicularis]|uniref:DUF1275 domain protein n=1 Tax=Cudoniella acicularis TaxID=354080 RepID=A0A8H4RTC6_9HELO|nr:hypothetical protein G7Y89_g3056 [Cudoniella acicularis]
MAASEARTEETQLSPSNFSPLKAEAVETKDDFNTHLTAQRTSTSLAPTQRKSFLTYMNEPIRDDLFLEMQLLLLAFCTGIQDACTYPDYLCFASNQTGNTLLLAIGISGLASSALEFTNIGISLALFVTGSWIAGQIGNAVGPRRRAWLLVSSLVQTMMVWAASPFSMPRRIRAPVAMARSLKITEITTAMATAAYVDLLIDPRLYARGNRSRNRRIAFLIMLAGGSFAGAFANKNVSSAFALLTYFDYIILRSQFLVRLAAKYQRQVTDSLAGNYDSTLESQHPLTLRMHIQNGNEVFGQDIKHNGHRSLFRLVDSTIDQSFQRRSSDKRIKSEESMYEWIRSRYHESHGAELPSTANPAVLESRFH